MFLLTPPSPSRTKSAQQTINAASPKLRFAINSDSERPKFNAENLPPLQSDPSRVMTTSHRGLDHGLPPGSILPDPLRPSASSHHSGHGGSPGQMPTYDSDERTRRSSWHYQAKSDEEKRRQEEERRRQEELRLRQEEIRLEQRKTEERMLRESISSGVHPNLVPLIFVGLGAGNVAGSGFEMAQQYIRQFQQVGQQVQSTLQTSSPDVRRDMRVPAQPQYGAIQQQQQQHPSPQYGPHGSTTAGAPSNAGVPSAQPAANVYPSPAYQSPQDQSRSLVSGSARFNAPATTPVLANQSALPRLTTNEAQVQYLAHAPPLTAGTPAHPQQVNSAHNLAQDGSSPSPSIYFHHWQPPATTNNSTPSGKDSQKVSPKNTSSDPSPRKRKAQGPHHPAPAPSSGLSRDSTAASRSSSTSSRRGERRKDSRDEKPHDGTRLEKLDSSKSDLKEDSSKDSAGPTPLSEEQSASEVQSSKDPESKPNT